MPMLTALRPAISQYKKQRGVGELLPWLLMINEGRTTINVDGSLMAGFSYVGPDRESCPDSTWRFGLESIMAAMRNMDNRNTVWTIRDKRRRSYVKPSDIGNDVARYFDDVLTATVDQGGLFSVRDSMYVGFSPFVTGDTFMEEMQMRMASGDNNPLKAAVGTARAMLSRQHRVERLESILDQSLAHFEQQLAALEAGFSVACGTRRLAGAEFLAHLSSRVNTTSGHRNSVANEGPGNPWLHTFLPSDSIVPLPSGVLEISGVMGIQYATLLTLRGSTPQFIDNSFMEELSDIPVPMIIAQMFRFMSKEQSKRRAMDAHRHYADQIKSPMIRALEGAFSFTSDRTNPEMQALSLDAKEAAAEVDIAALPNGFHQMTICVFGDTPEESEANARTVSAVLLDREYTVTRERMFALGAYQGTLPGARDLAVRAIERSGPNFVDLFPFRTRHTLIDSCPHLSKVLKRPQRALGLFPTRHDVPTWINLHVRDVGHFGIFGGTGRGKTTLANSLIMLWQRFDRSRVITLDMNFSTYVPIVATGGRYLDLRPGSPDRPRMNPMKWLHSDALRPKLHRFLQFAMEAFGAQPMNAAEITVLDKALDILAADGVPRRLANLYIVLLGTAPELAERLSSWVSFDDKRGRYGDLFDHLEDDLDLGGNVGLNAGDLIKDPNLSPAVLAYIFESIEDKMDGLTPTLIYLEEAWNNLRIPQFQAYWENCQRTMRAKLGVLGISTHSTKDMSGMNLSNSFWENLPTRFVLPSDEAENDSDVYAQLGMNDQQISAIASAQPNCDYYLIQGSFRRMLSMKLPNELRALTSGDVSTVQMFRRHENEANPNWLELYMEEYCNA